MADAVRSVLLVSNQRKFVHCWSPDGRCILYATLAPATNRPDIYALLLGDSIRTAPVLTGPFIETQAAISPDGKWLAFMSDESGQPEIYVQSFPGPGSQWRVSTTGGVEPAWRGDGQELYYVSLDSKMMAVGFTPGPRPGISVPRKLFDSPLGPPVRTRNRYVVTRDGQRFLFIAPFGEERVGATTVVLDWLGRLEKR